MATPFSYDPLPAGSIRVIKLFPARRPTDPLKCSIQHLELAQAAAQPYEALSYVWGEPSRQWPLDCNGKELLVTKNCHEALISLRPRFFARTLWIDAICINQATTDEATTERNGQVAMMGEVYSKASRVLIWLGAPDAFVPTLFRYFRSLHLFEEVDIRYPRLGAIFEPAVGRCLDINHGSLVKNKSARLWESLLRILNNPWFERVWTLQEVAFGRECWVIQGRHKLNWEALCMGYVTIPRRGRYRLEESDRLLSRWRLYLQLRGPSVDAIPASRFQGKGQRDTERDLLTEIRNMKATIPHDRVYALYALFKVMGLDYPSPDYNKNIVEVFQEAVVSYIRCRQNLNIITLTAPPNETSGFPSWVPDWLTPGYYSEPLIWKTVDHDTKPPDTLPVLTQNTGNGRLGVMGKPIGIIKKRICCPLVAESGLPKDPFHQAFVEVCLEWRRLVESLAEYPSGKDPKTIELALLRPYHHAVPDGVLKSWYRWLLNGCGTLPAMDDATLNEMAQKRRPRARWVVHVLDTGYVGMASRDCCDGDMVALLPSLNPLVLRPWKNDGVYRIITPAYCEGAMSGELNTPTEGLEELILV